MVSFSNGSVSGEVSNKRPLENGYMPKYKPRKVSAFREFPPGCGRNAVPMNLKPDENGPSEGGVMDAVGVVNSERTNALVANGAEISGMASLMESEAVGNSELPKNSNLDEIKGSEIQNVVGPNGVESSDIKVECQSHEAANSDMDVDVTESLDAIVEKVMANVNVSKKLEMENGPLRNQFLVEVGSHGHETVNNPLDAYVGKVIISNGFSNQAEELIRETNLIGVGTLNDMKNATDSGGQTTLQELNEVECLALFQNSGVEEAKSTFDADAIDEKGLLPGNPQALSSLSGIIKPETSTRLKDKYRPRKVFAFREFPPHCGRHVSLPIEEEKQRTMSGNDCLNGIEKVELAPEAAMLGNVSAREITGEVLTTSQKDMDGLQNIPVENGTTEALNDGGGRGLLGETAEVKTSIKDTGGPLGKEITAYSLDKNDNDRPQHSDFTLGNDSNREIVEKPKAVALNSNLTANNSGGPSLKKTALPDSYDADGSRGSLPPKDEGYHDAHDECMPEVTPIFMYKAVVDDTDNDYEGPTGTDVIVYSPGDTDEMRPSHNVFIQQNEVDREVVHGLMAAPNCPWRKGKTVLSNFDGEMSSEKKRKQKSSWRQKAKAVAKKSTPKIQSSGSLSKKHKKVHVSNDVDGNPGALILADDGGHDNDEDFPTDFPANHEPQDFVVNLPPFGPKTFGQCDDRNRVRETLMYFHVVYRKILQKEEAKSMPEEEGKSKQKKKRIDLMAAQVLKDNGKLVNKDKKIGQVLGVEVGDEFQYRVELAVVGIHFPYQSGIDSVKHKDVPLATSIVASGGYSDNLDDADVLIYSGQGGNVMGKSKEPEDQKLERGNLALRNSIAAQTPVRVVRGWKEMKYVDPLDPKPKLVTTYIYDGLYTVTRYWIEKGPRGKHVFQFELKRNPGQPELAWKELKKSGKFKTRPGVCIADISGGKEPSPISAVNTLDNEKPPPFKYISKMMYPDRYHPVPPAGCDCTGRCSDSKKCRCAVRNEGKIPYNRNGALVETKPVVYECGPHCKCPPSCYNRVSQRGIKFQLEVFKTESRGWGVRPLTSIPSGSFICEYAGELLEEKDAELKIGSDEYLFDIGQNYIDSSKPEHQEIAAELMEEGYTIDACEYGNVGRFINHSCLPNLHAQNVIYDHDDKKMPHIMLFAMENIPPLQELTYHYNYTIDQVRDSHGNIKTKKCYCGTAQCSGRMY